VEYPKTTIDILKRKSLIPHIPTRQQRAYRVVIINLHHSAQQELVRQDIERIRHKFRNVWNSRHRVTGDPLSLFFLNIEPAANNSEIYEVEHLKKRRVQIGPPHQKQNNMPKCKSCQAYFHNSGYCAHKPRCVKGGKSHSTEQCTLLKAQLATCLYCGESHPAIYKGCKGYQEIIRTRFSSPRTTAIIHITNTPGQENKSPAAPQKT
jgi:hypothetical protein